MPTALIAEDEELLAAHLRQELRTLWPELDVVGMAPHGEAAVAMTLEHRPDICFFDIRMPGLTGLEAAEQIAEQWPEGAQPFPLLVFVTAYDQFALQAFERAAVDYLLKPVQRERLAQTLGRLQAALAQRKPAGTGLEDALQQLRQLLGVPQAAAAPGASAALLPATSAPSASGALSTSPLPSSGLPSSDLPYPPLSSPAPAVSPLRHLQVAVGDSIVMVPVNDITYLEAADKYVRVVTADQEYLIRLSLRELLPQLDGQRFWQVHRGHIVQVDAIERVLKDETGRLSLKLRGRPERLAVSRMYAHLFKAL